jgi:hypothetical protein
MEHIQERNPLSKAEQNLGAVVTALAISLVFLYLSFAFIGFGSEAGILAAIGGSVLCAAGLCVIVLRKHRRAGKPLMIDYLNVSTQRYILALFMIFYGIDKILGNFFDYQLFALDSKLSEVSEFQLSWFFYGKNHWQELFAGFMEFVPGIFLFKRRTHYVAALILLPVTAQVFLLNFFFKIGGLTFPAATILLSCNLYIIYSQKEQILRFFRSLNFNVPSISGSTKTAVRVLRSAAIFIAVALVLLRLRPLVFQSAEQRYYHKLVGVYTLKTMTRNGLSYTPVKDSLYYRDLYIEKQSRWNILRRFDNETEAFVLRINPAHDSLALYINKGGIGDGPDIIDSATALSGGYSLNGKQLRISGVQMNDTLDLVYERQDRIKAKAWFW